MDRLELLCEQLGPKERYIYLDVYQILSSVYLLDGQEQQAYDHLEHLVQFILTHAGVSSVSQVPHTHEEASALKRILVKQLLCYRVVPDTTVTRNRTYIEQYQDRDKALALALSDSDYVSAIQISDTLLQRTQDGLEDHLFLVQLKIDLLATLPATETNAQKMLALTSHQDSIFRGINKHKEADYTTLALLQEQKKRLAELETIEKKQQVAFLHYLVALMVLSLALMIYLYISYKRRTQLKLRLLAEMKAAKQQGQEALESKQKAFVKQEKLVHNLNYEIRGPLNSLMGFSNLIASTSNLSKEDKDEANTIILDSNQKLTRLIGNLLDLARIESDKMACTMQNIAGKDIFLSYNWQELRDTLQPTHQLEVNLEETDTLVYTDTNHVQKIVHLLVINAKLVSDPGTISVSLHRRSHDVEIIVSCSTNHMSDEEILQVMNEQMTMNDYDNSSSYYLVLSRMLAKLIHGSLHLQSPQAEGLQLRLLLPTKTTKPCIQN